MKLRRVYPKHGAWYAVDDLPEINPKTGKPRQKWTRLTRIDQGEAALLAELAKLRGAGPLVKTGNLPARIAEFQKGYLPTLKNFRVRKEYERIYDLVAKAFADFDTDQVTSGDVAEFLDGEFPAKPNAIDKSPRTLTARAKQSLKSRLSTFFAWCCGPRRYATVNPCSQFKIKRTKARRYAWTPAKYHAIREQLQHGDDATDPQGAIMQCFMDLTFLVYQRNTDVRLLERGQIDRAAGLIRFVPDKTETTSGENVSVPITPAIAQILDRAAAVAKRYKIDVQRHIICKRDGSQYAASGIRSAWNRACAAAGITEGLTSKSLRNYAARTAKEAGYTKDQIQEALAHATVATTEGYLAANREVVSVVNLTLPARPNTQET